MTDPFARPSSDFFAAKDYQGKLCLFENIGQPGERKTDYGMSPCIDADVTVIDADGGPAVFTRSSVFGAALVGTLGRATPGKPLLGRIGQGQAKAGQSAPWILNDYTDADAALAGQYLTQRSTGQFSSPAAAVQGQGQPNVAAPQQSAIDVNDPAVQAALAALAAQGVAAAAPSEPPF